MLPWLKRMTVEDVEKARRLAAEKTPEEIVVLAAAHQRKDVRTKIAFLASCAAPFCIMIAMTLRPSDEVTAKIWIWVAAICIAMMLPLPMIHYHREGLKQGRIILLAWHLQRNPRLTLLLRKKP